MNVKWVAVILLWLWVCGMFATAFGARLLETWRGPDLSHSVTVPIQPGVVKVEVFRKPETVVEKTQERVEAPPIRTATAEESPAPAVTLPTPAPPAKAKRRKIVKKAPPPAPVLVGGQPQ